MFVDFNKVIGRRNGIVNEIIEAYVDDNEPQVYSFAGKRGFLPWESEDFDTLNLSGGGGLTKSEALFSCLGEIAERYCSSFINCDEVIEGSFNSLKNGNILVDPNDICLFSDQQLKRDRFPFKKFNRDSMIEWVPASSSKHKKDILIPSFLTYLPYDFFDRGGCYCPSSSTGLSCAASFNEAFFKGLLEIVERDSFTTMWINQLAPPKIDISGIAEFKEIRERFKFDDIDYNIFDITSVFGVPCVAAFCFGQASFGYTAALGLSCAPDYYSAIKKALTECVQARVSVAFHRMKEPQKKYRDDFLDVLDFKDHSYVYATDEKLKKHVDFLWKSDRTVDLRSLIDDFDSASVKRETLINRFISKGFDVMVKDLTTSDIKKTGLNVVRVLVPGMQFLHGIHAYPFLGNPRIYKPSDLFAWCDNVDSCENDVENFPPHLLG
ncbi:YcaO-like family protein [Patescibacteria group bacterium]|nr:YcaO-like family protein [Patescibacteria group bacterium]